MYMLLTAYQKPLSKTGEKSPAINSTTCLASRKIASKEFPITEITGYLLFKHLKERMSNSFPLGACYRISPLKKECPLKNFCWLSDPKSSAAEKKK